MVQHQLAPLPLEQLQLTLLLAQLAPHHLLDRDLAHTPDHRSHFENRVSILTHLHCRQEVMGSFDVISLTVGLLCTAHDICSSLLMFQKAVRISFWQIFSCVLSA
jgi:hypothetical protein